MAGVNMQFPYALGLLMPEIEVDESDIEFEQLAGDRLTRSVTDLPKRASLLEYMPKTRNQGRDGACVAFTVAGVASVHHWFDAGEKTVLSPGYVYKQRPNPTVEGMYLTDAFNIMKNLGICLERDCRSDNMSSKDDITQDAHEKAKNFQIQRYVKITTTDGMKQAIHSNSPIVCCFPVYDSGDHFWKKKSDGDKLEGYHAVYFYGYDDDKKEFLVQNSWGHLWGEDGRTDYPYAHWDQGHRPIAMYTLVDEKGSLKVLIDGDGKKKKKKGKCTLL